MRRSTLFALLLLLLTLGLRPAFAQNEAAAPAGDEEASSDEATSDEATSDEGAAPAETAAPAPGGAVEPILVGFNLTNLGKLDLATGAYNAEFFLTLTCPKSKPDCPKEFELDGGTITKSEKVDDEDGRTVFRVKAELSQDLDLSGYPFDEHVLSIAFVHPTADMKEVVYAVDKEDTDVSPTVKVPGFDIVDHEASVIEQVYDSPEDKSSLYNFDLTIKRVTLTSILKSYMPPLFIVFVASLGLLLKAKSVTNRLGMGTAGLLSAVMFHISSTSSLPPLGYLTRVDKFMLGVYVILVANIISTVLIMVRDDRKDEEGANSVFKLARIVVPVLALVILACVLMGFI